ncbi:MAG TPA: hypothetical protein VGB77_18805 [Abditibacteriaceae bacterium]|jgi:hypothetical protein
MPFSLRRLHATCFLTAVTLSSTAQAQLGPEVFATTHFFGASRATSIRAYGMGGGIATTPGPFSLNPAHAAFNDDPAGVARYGRTRFADGTRFNSAMLGAALPLGKQDGLQILYANVRSPEKSSFAAPAPGFAASTQVFHEESVSLFYGRRVSPRLALGIGVAPILRTRHEIRNVNFGAGPGTLRFSAKPPLDDLSHLGGRFGLDYKFASWGRFSGFYDNFWEDAVFFVPAQLAPLTTRRAAFHEVALTGGFHLTPTPKLTLVIERERATLTGGGFRLKGHNTYYGGEWMATKNLALRAGSHDGDLTYGLGWTKNRFSLQYAHVKNLAGDETRPFFGNNKFNVLEASYQF